MRWTVLFLNAVVASEVAALPDDMRARLARFVSIIQDLGFEALPRDSVKHLESKFGISRAIYVTASGQRVVVLRVFVKRTQKTPPREIEIARQRAKDVT